MFLLTGPQQSTDLFSVKQARDAQKILFLFRTDFQPARCELRPIKKHPVERGLRAYCLKLTASQLLRGALFTVCFFECRIIQPLNHGVDLFLGSAAVEGVIAF